MGGGLFSNSHATYRVNPHTYSQSRRVSRDRETSGMLGLEGQRSASGPAAGFCFRHSRATASITGHQGGVST